MTRGLFSIGVASVLVAGVFSGFVGFPVFADGPVDISIVEKVDDGTGNYKDWEDITGAMPGAVYSAIPRVKNNGTIAVPVNMCLSESGMDAAGNGIGLEAGTFAIEINDGYWTRIDGEDGGGALRSPIEVCYRYNSELAVGGVSEPLFYEVSLSSELGNEYQGATFTLHLEAYASGDLPDEVVSPGEPDTGAFTNSEPLTTVGYVALSVGLIALLGMVALLVAKSVRKK